MTRDTIYIDNDNDLYISGLRTSGRKTYTTDAVITVSLLDASGNAVSGAQDISCPFVGGSNGDYRGVATAAMCSNSHLTAGSNYTAVFESSNYGLHWELPLRAAVRDK